MKSPHAREPPRFAARNTPFNEQEYRTVPQVFGDRTHHTACAAIQRDIARALAHSADSRVPIDPLREALILAGQLEQSASDDHPGSPLETAAIRLTDSLAAAFLDALEGHPAPPQPKAAAALKDLAPHNPELRIKDPEGFAHYALFPEQYAASAARWLAQNRSIGSIRIVGIRSIGTTLSAVVLATLARAGRDTRRTTLRPTGHPFDRRAELSAARTHDITHALIVDEGPGLSGSSMVAAGLALERSGLSRSRITFLPGHNHGPGAAASEEIRAYWSSVPTLTTDRSEIRWNNASLLDTFRTHSHNVLNEPITDIRECTTRFPLTLEHPASALEPPFERLRFLCTSRSGASVLWTFRGFTRARAAAAEISHRAVQCWTPPLIAIAHGFTAQPWPADTRPAVPHETGDIIPTLARYLADISGPALAPTAAAQSIERLAHMLTHNTREFLGDAHIPAADSLARQARACIEAGPAATCGDANLAPREWVFAGGRPLKLDPIGHLHDHTLIGAQPLEWALAAAIVEWQLPESAAATLAPHAAPPRLTFYTAAYAAFRLAQLAIHSASTGRNTTAAAANYRADLLTALAAPPTAPAPPAPCCSRTTPRAPNLPPPRPTPTPG